MLIIKCQMLCVLVLLSMVSHGSSFGFPGTKWCGQGTSASHYYDLGSNRAVDMCCREHDYCDDYLLPGQFKHGLYNGGEYTKSHCSCDEKFKRCLKKTDSYTGAAIGYFFFNSLKIKCFREEYPVIGCWRYRGWFSWKCAEPEYAEWQRKRYQFFDLPEY